MTQIYIKPMKDKAKKITLQVDLEDSIDELKRKIEIREGTPADRQRLFLNWSGTSRSADKELLEYAPAAPPAAPGCAWVHLLRAGSVSEPREQDAVRRSLASYNIKKGSTIYIDTGITEGDKVYLLRDPKKTGKVIIDDGTANPYVVRWDDDPDGRESSPLKPEQLKKASEVSTFLCVSLSRSLLLSRSVCFYCHIFLSLSLSCAHSLSLSAPAKRQCTHAHCVLTLYLFHTHTCRQMAQLQIKSKQDVKIYIRLLGKAHPVTVKLTDHIHEVKSKIEVSLGKEVTPAYNQCIFFNDKELEFNDKELEDWRTLDDCKIKARSCIEIRKKLIGMKWVDVGTQVPRSLNDFTALKWLPAGITKPAMGRNLEHEKLAKALENKTEFTKEEWEKFDIEDLICADHFIKSGNEYFQPLSALLNKDYLLTVGSSAQFPAYKAETMNYLKVVQVCNKVCKAAALKISIISALHLPKMDKIGKCDAYCEVTWKGKNPPRMEGRKSTEIVKTGTVKNSYDAYFDLQAPTTKPFNVFEFEKLSEDWERDLHGLEIVVKDWDRHGKDEVVGYVLVSADMLDSARNPMFDGLLPVRRPRSDKLSGKVAHDLDQLGLKWLPAGNTEPAEGRNLEHEKLAKALENKTEFTKEEWKKFDIKDLCADHFIKSGNWYFQPAEDVRGFDGKTCVLHLKIHGIYPAKTTHECYVQYRKNVRYDQIMDDFGIKDDVDVCSVKPWIGSEEESVKYIEGLSKKGIVTEFGTRIDTRFVDLAYNDIHENKNASALKWNDCIKAANGRYDDVITSDSAVSSLRLRRIRAVMFKCLRACFIPPHLRTRTHTHAHTHKQVLPAAVRARWFY
jgi:hypothetical protein